MSAGRFWAALGKLYLFHSFANTKSLWASLWKGFTCHCGRSSFASAFTYTSCSRRPCPCWLGKIPPYIEPLPSSCASSIATTPTESNHSYRCVFPCFSRVSGAMLDAQMTRRPEPPTPQPTNRRTNRRLTFFTPRASPPLSGPSYRRWCCRRAPRYCPWRWRPRNPRSCPCSAPTPRRPPSPPAAP